MNSRPLLLLATVTLLGLSISAAQASDWQVNRLAEQLEHASGLLSNTVKNQRGFSSVSHHAYQLSRQADRLADTTRRSDAIQRSMFNELSRDYRSLETAFLRANSHYDSRQAAHRFDQIASLFAELNRVMYYNNTPYGYDRVPDYYSYTVPRSAPPRIIITPPRVDYYPRNDRRNDRDGYRNDQRYDHRSPVQERQRQRDYDSRDSRPPGLRDSETRRDNHYEGNNGSYRLGRRP